MPRRRPEEALHRDVAQLLWAACPELLWWTIPNQRGTRARFEMGVLRSLGVRKGVGDIGLVVPPGGTYGCIELKAGKGRVSPEQLDYGMDLRVAGGLWAVCRSLDDVIATLQFWGVPMRRVV